MTPTDLPETPDPLQQAADDLLETLKTAKHNHMQIRALFLTPAGQSLEALDCADLPPERQKAILYQSADRTALPQTVGGAYINHWGNADIHTLELYLEFGGHKTGSDANAKLRGMALEMAHDINAATITGQTLDYYKPAARLTASANALQILIQSADDNNHPAAAALLAGQHDTLTRLVDQELTVLSLAVSGTPAEADTLLAFGLVVKKNLITPAAGA